MVGGLAKGPHLLSFLAAIAALLMVLSPSSIGTVDGRASAAELSAPNPPGGGGNGKKATATPTPTATGTSVATATATVPSGSSPTATASATSTPGATATATSTPTPASGGAATATPVGSLTATSTPVVSLTATSTPVGALTATATPTTGLSSAGAPGNDSIKSATQLLSFPSTVSQDTTLATAAPDDPDMRAGTGVNSSSVWFSFVAPSASMLHAQTFGSSFDTVLAAYRGAPGSLTWVAANDDASGTSQSEIYFSLQAGTTYYLEVADYGSAAGGGQLTLTVEVGNGNLQPTATATLMPTATATSGSAPANDDLNSATVIGGLPFTTTQDTSGATAASDDPSMGGGAGQNSKTVWFSFVAPASGTVQASSLGSNYDTVLAVFTGSRGSLSLVANNDDANGTNQSQLSFAAQAGATYYLEAASYGALSQGGLLQLSVTMGASGTPTATPTPVGSVTATATPSPAPTVAPAVLGARSVARDARYFSQTGYRINVDAFWDFFQKRGGVRTLGYPVSWEFTLLGFQVQFFQRAVLQRMPGGSVAMMNLLDEGLMPYSQINFSSYPAPDRELIQTAPSPSDPEYATKAIAFVRANVPDQWEGMSVNFQQSYLSTVRYEDAFPGGDGEPALVPLLNLELWGLPTSRPAYDPNNRNFVYQRFQRGILHYDASTGATQGLLLADYLKGIVTGRNLPPDLDQQAQGSRFYRQYDPTRPGYLSRPEALVGSNLQGAFEGELFR